MNIRKYFHPSIQVHYKHEKNIESVIIYPNQHNRDRFCVLVVRAHSFTHECT
ncbi:hypothetical protein BN1088_1430078 [Sphingobacterium sp. PM2-P1-29]|nr:hypothetical protein BN1088_1430078 [Sphingobacterium sp. PM2-P1-29]